jgi:tetratricopeptide (TPR) repeat protein
VSDPGTDRWRQIDALVERALDCPAAERDAFLAQACEGDEELRREVASLLAHDGDEKFLATPATAEAAALLRGGDFPSLVGERVGRFTVLARLGAGGMGEVYLAQDPQLERRVALKFPLLGPTDDAVARERLRREARAAAGLAHPAICRVFELGEVDGRTFIVMEHLEGETLAERLARGGVPLARALTWAAAIAGALEEAHAKGLVHRDLKPANVMVLPDDRVKVLDFGLARSPRPSPAPASSRPDATLGDGLLFGTPGYMAPEQLDGAAADTRTDVWALGCVLFQMLTGERAFAGTSPETAAAAIRDQEPPWERLPAATPQEVRRLLRRCLAKDPRQRLRDAGDLRLALEEASTELRSGSTPAARRPVARARSAARAGLAAVGLVAVFAVGWILRDGGPLAGGRPVETVVRGVAVAAFENRTGDPALSPVGTMAAGAISQELPRLEFLRRPRGHQGEVAASAPAHTRISGAYYTDGEELRVTATITAADGEVLHAIEPGTGPRTRPGVAVELARQRTLGALATLLDPRFLPGAQSRPPLYDAYREFMAGMHLFGVDYTAAIPHFERALAIDPGFFGALNVLATSYGNLGDPERQRRILEQATTMRQRLTTAERLTLAWSLAEAEGRHVDALLAIRQRAALEPDNQLVHYLHSYYALRLNRPAEALAAAERFDMAFWDSGPRGDWSWARRTDAQHLLGQHQEELALAREARERHPSSLLARGSELYALAALGRIAELERALDEAMTLEGGPASSPGLLMLLVATELGTHGHPEAQARVAARAVSWYQHRPAAVLDQPKLRQELGRALLLAGRLDEAAAIARELLTADASNHRHHQLAGQVAARRGDRTAARRNLTALAALEDQRGEVFLARARLAALLGEREAAITWLREGLARGLELGVPLHRDRDLATLRGWPPFDELVEPRG